MDSDIATVDFSSFDLRTMILSLLVEMEVNYDPSSIVIFQDEIDGKQYTITELREQIISNTDVGQRYIKEILSFARDFVAFSIQNAVF